MNPFAYPKSIHQRQFTPKQYKRYQTYKRILRLEFGGKCVYCQMPSSVRGYESFGVDHYRPQKSFSHLATAYGNLFYCCSSCNSAKGAYWPASAAKEKTEFIPNPCDHRMFDHLRFSEAEVQWKTKAGEVAATLLDLNDPQVVEYRQFVLTVLEASEEKKSKLLRQRVNAEKKAKSGSLTPAQAAQATAEIDAELHKIEKALKTLSGVS